MADHSLSQARTQNESLEKSLKLLRGKLSGARDHKDFYNGQERALRAAPNENIQDVYTKRQKDEPKRARFANRPSQSIETQFSAVPANNAVSGKTGISVSSRANVVKTARSAFLPSKHEENYFDEFRNKVHKIRKASHNESKQLHETFPQNQPRKSRDGESQKAVEPKQLLVAKIQRQGSLIADLEKEVHNLRAANQSLVESRIFLDNKLQSVEADRQLQEERHYKELSDLEASFNFHNLNLNQNRNHETSEHNGNAGDREELEQLRAELADSKKQNAELRGRVSEIAERAHFLNSIHEQRVKTLENKLEASVGVAKYYCKLSGSEWREVPDDSTEEILFGPQEDTTMDLLRAAPGFNPGSKNGKKSLRSYFLAVLFMVRLKNELEANKLWEPYIEFGKNQDSR